MLKLDIAKVPLNLARLRETFPEVWRVGVVGAWEGLQTGRFPVMWEGQYGTIIESGVGWEGEILRRKGIGTG